MYRILLLFSFLLLFQLTNTAQQYSFQNYSVGDGLAQSQVFTMLEDSRGYIWMGTSGGGLSRFDGKNFQNFTVNEGLINNYIEALYEDTQQNLWIGTKNGLSKFDGNSFVNYPIEQNRQVNVGGINQDATGLYWVGTDRGIYTFDGESFTNFSKAKRLPISKVLTLFNDSKNNLWFGTERGTIKIKNSKAQLFDRQSGMSNTGVESICEDTDGNIWMGTYGGINIYDGEQFSQLNKTDGLPENSILSLFKDHKDMIWVGTQKSGIAIWNPRDSTFNYIQEQKNSYKDDGLCNNYIRTMLQDRWDNIWIGTSGGGISKYFEERQLFVHKDEGLLSDNIYAISEDTSGQIWVSTYNKGVSLLDGNQLVNYGRDSGFVNRKSKAIYTAKDGKIWFGTEGEGLAIFDGQQFRFIRAEDGLASNRIRDILQDSLGHFWVATAGDGITRLTRNDSTYVGFDFKRFHRRTKLPDNRVNCLHLDKKNRIWFGLDKKGMGYIQDSTIVSLSKKDGLPSDEVHSIIEDDKGNLWIGMADAGICRLSIYGDSLLFQVPEMAAELSSNTIYLLALDDDQNLWVGSEKGVDKAVLNTEGYIKEVKHYGILEGFKGKETSQNAVYKDSKGNLWFGTVAGLTQYNPKRKKRNPIPPNIQITDIKLFYESLRKTKYADWVSAWGGIKEGLELPYRENHLGFEFLGINQSNPEKVRYQWRLKGIEKNWVPAEASFQNNVTYSNLPPGDYTFMVRAFNEDDVFNQHPIKISFNIKTPFWQQWWFILSSILLTLLLIALVFKLRLNQIKAKATQDRERLEMEKNLLSLEQKALQLQMNPHFIFNALNSIQGIISKQDHKTARYQLAKFSKLMRSILENSRETSIPLETEIETLEHYLAVEQFSRGNTFDFHVEVADNIDPEETYIPPMMLQPFVENAIIHGIAHIQEKGKITIQFERDFKTLQCTITDNGIGRQKAKAIKSQTDQQHKSTALKVTQERLDILNTKSNAKKSLEVVDLVDAHGEAAGTKVVVRFLVTRI